MGWEANLGATDDGTHTACIHNESRPISAPTTYTCSLAHRRNVSHDEGATWNDFGIILEASSNYAFSAIRTTTTSLARNGMILSNGLISTKSIFTFFGTDPSPDEEASVSIARMRLCRPQFNLSARFGKWRDGTWNEPWIGAATSRRYFQSGHQ